MSCQCGSGCPRCIGYYPGEGQDFDFEQRVRDDGYKNQTGQFMTDLTAWLTEQGVPQQYAAKVAHRAWEEGHAYGYAEVFTVAQGLLEIFQ